MTKNFYTHNINEYKHIALKNASIGMCNLKKQNLFRRLKAVTTWSIGSHKKDKNSLKTKA